MPIDADAERRAAEERERVSAGAMQLLTAGLTSEADTFLIAFGTAMVVGGLYPLIGAWGFLAFPAVFAVAVLARRARRRRR